ncbi:hypothetical protein SAMN05421747_11483 [Parapedobacter composti]|uniref:Outer membrane protein beta-barrel domain-containing protein n=1 Tax=Parapedobacter composti TaxID=623281 RepID=A0A1I1K401_9SPHI|nr:hypothetical protein [Parapedobacter composti]SFC55574.1 hypothetical protein SAMN05421747_11483 [Parapedobacter composti]
MKKGLLFAVCCISLSPYLQIQAQPGNESPIPYYRYALSAGVGPAYMYGDLQKKHLGGGVFLRGDYFLRHGLSIGLEANQGVTRSGDQHDVAVYPVSIFFFSGLFNGRIYPLQFIQSDHDRRIMYRKSYLQKAINTAYVGAGVGAVFNLTTSDEVETYNNGHLLSSFFHTDIGLDLPLSKYDPQMMDTFFWYVCLNAQLNFATNRGMDGFGEERDRYGLFSVGFKLKL